MEYTRFGNKVVARFDKGEEIVGTLTELCKKESIRLASVSAIGAVGEATLGCFNTNEKKYYSNDYIGIYEIASLSGNVSTMDGQVYLHLHCALADEDCKTIGGHLNRALVSATCEMIIDIIDGEVDRVFSEETGLNLIKF